MSRVEKAVNPFFVKALHRAVFYTTQYWNLYVVRDPQTIWVRKWHRDNGDKTLRLEYPLTSNSIVFDLGGYEGVWTAEIYERYRCSVFVFEPVPQFYHGICDRFAGARDIHPFNFGLADSSRIDSLILGGDASSLFKKGGQQIQIQLIDILDFLSDMSITKIDLIKINIEGAEYDLLERMIVGGVVQRCTDIQIQFHRFAPGAEARRGAIRNVLLRTHDLTYDYPFVWENWQKHQS